jgi:hypothetical protein
VTVIDRLGREQDAARQVVRPIGPSFANLGTTFSTPRVNRLTTGLTLSLQ